MGASARARGTFDGGAHPVAASRSPVPPTFGVAGEPAAARRRPWRLYAVDVSQQIIRPGQSIRAVGPPTARIRVGAQVERLELGCFPFEEAATPLCGSRKEPVVGTVGWSPRPQRRGSAAVRNCAEPPRGGGGGPGACCERGRRDGAAARLPIRDAGGSGAPRTSRYCDEARAARPVGRLVDDGPFRPLARAERLVLYYYQGSRSRCRR